VQNIIPDLLSVANACETLKLSWRFSLRRRRIGCCFDFSYRRNIENRLLTRFDSLPVDKLTGCPDLLVRQTFKFACAAVTHLNRIYLCILNRDRCPSSIAQPVDSAPVAMTRTSFPATVSFWSGGWAPAPTHTSEIKMATRRAKRIPHLHLLGPSPSGGEFAHHYVTP